MVRDIGVGVPAGVAPANGPPAARVRCGGREKSAASAAGRWAAVRRMPTSRPCDFGQRCGGKRGKGLCASTSSSTGGRGGWGKCGRSRKAQREKTKPRRTTPAQAGQARLGCVARSHACSPPLCALLSSPRLPPHARRAPSVSARVRTWLQGATARRSARKGRRHSTRGGTSTRDRRGEDERGTQKESTSGAHAAPFPGVL